MTQTSRFLTGSVFKISSPKTRILQKIQSSSRLCDRVQYYITMPREACQNGPTNTYVVTTPIGEMTLVACSRGIHSLQLPRTHITTPDLSVPVVLKDQTYQDNGYTYKPAVECIDWLKVYFSGSKKILRTPRPPVCLLSLPYGKTSFGYRVWQALADQVAYGTRLSYQQLATMCGSPRAQQSVGTAMKNNPISLIVPCHRIIRASGQTGNYAGGVLNPTKVWLLDYEKKVCDEV